MLLGSGLMFLSQTMMAQPGHKFENGQVDQYNFEKGPFEEKAQKAHEQGWAKFAPNGNCCFTA